MFQIIVTGACGRMGRAILSCAAQEKDFEIIGALEAPGHPELGKPATAAPSIFIADNLSALKGRKGILIDFSSPFATMQILPQARETGMPCVIGTTGLAQEQAAKLKDAARDIPIVFSSNMSVGVNLLFKLVEEAARTLGSAYDVEIFEMHHRFKKDAPSGTAKSLVEAAAKGMGLDSSRDVVHGRNGIAGERPAGQIGVHALRGGDVIGEHNVIFASIGERIEMGHRCHSRETFARGALRAARFVYERAPGLYTMRDVLGL